VIHLSPPPVTPLAVACDDRHALPDSDEPRNRNPPDHPAPLLAAAAAAAAAVASPHAALALSGGSMGGCSDTSSSYSSSFSSSSSSDSFSSWSSSSDSWRSSSSSSSSPPKKKKVVVVESADLETHESVGTAASPPPPPPVALTPWEKFWISVAVVLGVGGLVFGLIFLIKRSIPPPRTISVVKLQVNFSESDLRVSMSNSEFQTGFLDMISDRSLIQNCIYTDWMIYLRLCYSQFRLHWVVWLRRSRSRRI
jgi:hypothetical protein